MLATLRADGPLGVAPVGRAALRGRLPRGAKAVRRRGFAASAALHLALVLLLIALPVGRRLRPILTDPVAVEIVTPAAAPDRLPAGPAVPTPPADAAPADAAPAPQPSAAAPATPQASGMVEATRMMARDLLDRPDNRQAREALAGLVEDEQILQLCALEGMEQIAAWDDAFAPEQLEPDAMTTARLTRTTVEAEGAAVLSKGAWYNLRFACELSADLHDVVSFAFEMGDPIPRRDWAAHYLAADDGETD